MEFQKVIESRRSIRKYDPNQKVTRTQVEEMIKAAMLAPTWKNSQTASRMPAMPTWIVPDSQVLLRDFGRNDESGAQRVFACVQCE